MAQTGLSCAAVALRNCSLIQPRNVTYITIMSMILCSLCLCVKLISDVVRVKVCMWVGVMTA